MAENFIECAGCEARLPLTSPGRSHGDIMRDTGCTPIFSVRDGLTSLWFCPVCAGKMKEGVTKILSVVSKKHERDMPYLHWTGLVDLVLDRKKRGSG